MAKGATTYDVQDFEVGLGYFALHAELGHEEGLVNVHGIVGVGVPVGVGQWLGLVFSARCVAERVALEARRQECGGGVGARDAATIGACYWVVVFAEANAGEQIPLWLECVK